MIKRAGDVLGALERALTVIAVVFMFVIMLLVVTDVFMRYALNSPFSFTYDLIGLYLLSPVCSSSRCRTPCVSMSMSASTSSCRASR
ncbi:hypothetical protein ACVWXQ_004743 [Bradyrhizobium sp. S3.14.4]